MEDLPLPGALNQAVVLQRNGCLDLVFFIFSGLLEISGEQSRLRKQDLGCFRANVKRSSLVLGVHNYSQSV